MQERRFIIRGDEHGGKVGGGAGFVRSDVVIVIIRRYVCHFMAGFVVRFGRSHRGGANLARAERRAQGSGEKRQNCDKSQEARQTGVDRRCCALHHFFTLPRCVGGVNMLVADTILSDAEVLP